jgi:hypothetical protein
MCREILENLYLSNKKQDIFSAIVGYRRSGVRLKGKPAQQKILLDVKNKEGILCSDHLIMTVGQHIPDVPLIYSRISPGSKISFLGEIVPYTRGDKTKDYNLILKDLISSSPIIRDSRI